MRSGSSGSSCWESVGSAVTMLTLARAPESIRQQDDAARHRSLEYPIADASIRGRGAAADLSEHCWERSSPARDRPRGHAGEDTPLAGPGPQLTPWHRHLVELGQRERHRALQRRRGKSCSTHDGGQRCGGVGTVLPIE